MKSKKTAPSRRRISFAVDRDEIEINSDWVDAVMASPNPATVAPFPAPVLPGANPPDSAVFFVPEENNATDANSATGARCTPVENPASVVESAPVAESSAVESSAPVEKGAPVENSATDKDGRAADFGNSPVESSATDEDSSPVANIATVEQFSSTKDHRISRPRPIVRVTDGLTPGQYAVYSLMYEAGQGSDDGASRIYKGGYADLGRLTGLSKRGLQNVIAELQTKLAIRIHQQPGYHRTETSAYQVFAPAVVLQAWSAQGWRHALGKSKTLVN